MGPLHRRPQRPRHIRLTDPCLRLPPLIKCLEDRSKGTHVRSDPDFPEISAAMYPDALPAPSYSMLLLLSLLAMMNMPVFYTTIVGTDQYGFYSIDSVPASPWPLVLSISLSVILSICGYSIYRLLWSRQRLLTGGWWGPLRRNVVLHTVPVFVAIGPWFCLTSYGGKSTVMVIGGLMAGSLSLTGALNDRETILEPDLAMFFFQLAFVAIVVMSTLAVGAMLFLYSSEQVLPTGNWFWTWEYSWDDLGYPPDEFAQRQRDALVLFTLMGSGYMVVILGGFLLWALFGWTRSGRAMRQDGLSSAALLRTSSTMDRLVQTQSADANGCAFFVALNGHEIEIDQDEYLRLVGNLDTVFYEADLVVDKNTYSVFIRESGRLVRLRFQGRNAPFLLLCILARHPSVPFSAGQLKQMLMIGEMPERQNLNVSDAFNQLRARKPLGFLVRDDSGMYIPASIKVCYLDQRPVGS